MAKFEALPEPLFLRPLLPEPHFEIRQGSDRELRIFLETVDSYPDRRKSYFCFFEVVSEIEEILFGPERRDIYGIA